MEIRMEYYNQKEEKQRENKRQPDRQYLPHTYT